MKNLLVFAVLVMFASALFTAVFFGVISLGLSIKYFVVIALIIGGASLLVTFLASVVLSRRSAKSLLTNLTLLLVTITLLLVAGEYGLRYLYMDVTTTGQNLGYFEKTWHNIDRVNRFGFRERDYELEKAPDTYRIAVIGDSFTFGQGIAEEDRFSNLLEQRLNADKSRRDVRYEVLNFGQPGKNTQDETGVLNKFVLPAKPDFIILQWYKNDVIDFDAKKTLKEEQDSSWVSHKFGEAHQHLVNNSLLFSLLDVQLLRLKHVLLSKFDTRRLTTFDDKSMWMLFGDPDSASSVRAKNALLNFLEIAKNNSVPVGMVLFTDSYFRPSSELDYLLERVLDECDREKIICVDMRKPLEPYQGDMKLWANKLDPHPSAFANRITADEMFAAFSPAWLGRD